MNLLIQTCAGNFFFLFVQRALEGNITVRQMIELGVLPCFIFSHCLRQRFAVFHGGARTQQRMNRICTKTQSDALCIRRSLVLGRLRGECRPIKRLNVWQSVVQALQNYRIHFARASLSMINRKMKAGIKLLPTIVLFQNFCRANDDFMKIWIRVTALSSSMLFKIFCHWERDIQRPGMQLLC